MLSFLDLHHTQDLDDQQSKNDTVTPLIWNQLLHQMFVPLKLRLSAGQVTWSAEHKVLKTARQELQSKQSKLPQRVSSKRAPMRVMTEPPPNLDELANSPPHTPEEVPPGYQGSSPSTGNRSRDPQPSLFGHSHQLSDTTIDTKFSGEESPCPPERTSLVGVAMSMSPPAMSGTEGLGVHGVDRMSPPPLDLHNGTTAMAHRFSGQSQDYHGTSEGPSYTQYQPLGAPMSEHWNDGRMERKRQNTHQDLNGGLRHGITESGTYHASTTSQPAAPAEALREKSQDSLVTEAQVMDAKSPKPKMELSVEELHQWAVLTHEHSGWPKLRGVRKEYFLKHEKELVDQLRKRDHVSIGVSTPLLYEMYRNNANIEASSS